MKNWIGYCWFETIEQLIEDHKAIKKQIKWWEEIIDEIVDINMDPDNREPRGTLEEISHEMCAINI